VLGVTLYVATDNSTVEITGTDPAMKFLIDGQVVGADTWAIRSR
jgi:hypothetical protein